MWRDGDGIDPAPLRTHARRRAGVCTGKDKAERTIVGVKGNAAGLCATRDRLRIEVDKTARNRHGFSNGCVPQGGDPINMFRVLGIKIGKVKVSKVNGRHKSCFQVLADAAGKGLLNDQRGDSHILHGKADRFEEGDFVGIGTPW